MHYSSCPDCALKWHMWIQGQKAVIQDSSAYMTGILEVPLGIDFRMRNIEDTEAAKRKLLSGAAGGRDG